MRSADDEKQRKHREEVQSTQSAALQSILRAGEKDLRTILNLSQTDALTTGEVTKAFRKQSLLVHPDKNSDPRAEEGFKKLQAAYSQLKEEVARGGGGPRAPSTVPESSYNASPAAAGGRGYDYAGRSAGGAAERPAYGRAGGSSGAYSQGNAWGTSASPGYGGTYRDNWSRAQEESQPWGSDREAHDEFNRWARDQARRQPSGPYAGGTRRPSAR